MQRRIVHYWDDILPHILPIQYPLNCYIQYCGFGWSVAYGQQQSVYMLTFSSLITTHYEYVSKTSCWSCPMQRTYFSILHCMPRDRYLWTKPSLQLLHLHAHCLLTIAEINDISLMVHIILKIRKYPAKLLFLTKIFGRLWTFVIATLDITKPLICQTNYRFNRLRPEKMPGYLTPYFAVTMSMKLFYSILWLRMICRLWATNHLYICKLSHR